MNEKDSKKEKPDRDSTIIGHITGGVLHDFNNVLQGIIGLAEMLDADPSVPEKAKLSMKAIRRLGENATLLVQKIDTEGQNQPPTLEQKTKETIAAKTDTKSLPKNKLSILVAEDDPLVLNVITGMLKHFGYDIIGATDGDEAFRAFCEHSERIALVLTDLAMPRMGGLELAEKLLAQRPDTKIVVMTGYLQEEFDINPDEFGLAGWLEKPMTAEKLRQVVQPLMETKRP
jgi:CheY-like chemotaxis protein